MPQLQTIGTYQTKTHLAEVLRRVRSGQGFTITQRGEPIADLLPAGTRLHRDGMRAAQRMRRFIDEAPGAEPTDIKALIEQGRD